MEEIKAFKTFQFTTLNFYPLIIYVIFFKLKILLILKQKF